MSTLYLVVLHCVFDSVLKLKHETHSKFCSPSPRVQPTFADPMFGPSVL